MSTAAWMTLGSGLGTATPVSLTDRMSLYKGLRGPRELKYWGLGRQNTLGGIVAVSLGQQRDLQGEMSANLGFRSTAGVWSAQPPVPAAKTTLIRCGMVRPRQLSRAVPRTGAPAQVPCPAVGRRRRGMNRSWSGGDVKLSHPCCVVDRRELTDSGLGGAWCVSPVVRECCPGVSAGRGGRCRRRRRRGWSCRRRVAARRRPGRRGSRRTSRASASRRRTGRCRSCPPPRGCP
jgi:hypothetical protein